MCLDKCAYLSFVHSDLLGERIVTIIVGANGTSFKIHQNVLSETGKDSFFDVTFKKNFPRDHDWPTELPEEDPDLKNC